MAACEHCLGEMLEAGTCTITHISIVAGENARQRLPRLRYAPTVSMDDGGWSRCGDCGAIEGGFHHPGCDQERCPKCGKQLLGCGHGRGAFPCVAAELWDSNVPWPSI